MRPRRLECERPSVGRGRACCGRAPVVIQRQLGHANLSTTSIYLQRIDPDEIIAAVRTRRAPMISASAGLRL